MKREIFENKSAICLDLETTGLVPWYGDQITCICAKPVLLKKDGPVQNRFFMPDYDKGYRDELTLINAFLDWLSTFKAEEYFLLTKNGKQFDIPFLLSRLALSVDLNRKSGLFILEYDHIDLQEVTKKRVSLQSMAELLGCSPKSGDGKNAIKLWNEGRLEELKEYCWQDVLTTEEVFLKWRELNGKM